MPVTTLAQHIATSKKRHLLYTTSRAPTGSTNSSTHRAQAQTYNIHSSPAMGFILRAALIATAYFALRSQALPRPAVPTYSVVAVDGGQDSDATPTTIVRIVTDSKSSPTTVRVTIEEAQAPATTTILSTQPASTVGPSTITIDGEVTTAYPPTVVVPGSRTSYTTTAILSETTTVVDSEQTTIYSQGPTMTVLSMVTPSTSYFDDGMWHTSYGVPVWPTKNRALDESNATTLCSTTAARATARRHHGGKWSGNNE